MANSNEIFDIYLSYSDLSPVTNKTQIDKLKKRLTENRFKVWLDYDQILLEDKSMAKTMAIQNVRLILCCVTKA